MLAAVLIDIAAALWRREFGLDLVALASIVGAMSRCARREVRIKRNPHVVTT